MRRLTLCAMLCAIALTIFAVEAQIPMPVAGMKLGLSNVVTVFALAFLGWKEALAILLVRVLLGNFLTGQVSAIFYSLGGGLAAFACMALLLPRVKQLWVVSVLGALAHTLGQMAVAVAIAQTPALLYYLPPLLLCGMITGACTGVCAQQVCKRLTNGGKKR